MSIGKKKDVAGMDYPRVALGAWHGMPIGTSLEMWIRNGGSFSWRRTDRLITILLAGILNSSLNSMDRLLYGRRVRESELRHPPVFILGHWRTGTTLLHELLVRDPQFSYPSTYQCFAPAHFLISAAILPRMLNWLLPQRRPMDNMPVGWGHPQEDEFALCNQGIRSPYLFWMYPDRPCPFDNYLDLSGIDEAELTRWKEGLLRFMKRVSLRDPRTLVLKSPTHTARIKTLLEMFPGARFIHLVRDPQVMIPSTILTWRRLGQVSGVRVHLRDDLTEYVLDNFRRMDISFEQQRSLIPASQFYQVRFEDLTAHMVDTVVDLYEHLSLGDISTIYPHLEAYVDENKNYRKNAFEVDSELRDLIAHECRAYSERYGYENATV